MGPGGALGAGVPVSARGYNRTAAPATLTIEAAVSLDPMVLRERLGEAKAEGARVELALCLQSAAVLATVYREGAVPRMYTLRPAAIVAAVLAAEAEREDDEEPPAPCTCEVGGAAAAPGCPRHAEAAR